MSENIPDFFTSSPLCPAPRDFYIVARELQNLVYPDANEFDARRKHERIPKSIPISVQPLDEDFQPLGDRFWVVSRDISLKGIGLISYDPINHPYVRLGLLNDRLSVLGQIRHTTSISQKYSLFLVGIEYLS